MLKYTAWREFDISDLTSYVYSVDHTMVVRNLARRVPPNMHNGHDYIMAGHAIVVVKDITLLFYYGNAVILTLW